MSLFPVVLKPGEASQEQVVSLQQQAFSSFDASAYATHRAQQRRAGTGASLAAAAQYFSSSSEDSGSDNEAGPQQLSAREVSPGTQTDRAQDRPRQHRPQHRKDHHKHKQHKHKRRKHRTEVEKIVEQERKARDAGIHLDQPLPSIVGEEAAKEDLFQLDTRGDLNNLQFESMYKPPARRAWDPQGLARGPREPPSIASLRQERATVPSLEHATSGSRRLPHAFRGIGTEVDDDRQAAPARLRRRFFLQGAQRRERDQSLRRFRLTRRQQRQSLLAQGKPRLNMPSPGFVPLRATPEEAPQAGQQPGSENNIVAETAEQAHQRRGLELYLITRERPHELQPWMDLAELEASRFGQIDITRLPQGSAERIASIMDGALVHHPGSEALLSTALAAQKPIMETFDAWQQLWRQALGKYSGSVRLWREFIDMHTRFLDEAHTTLQDVLHAHGEALRALGRELVSRVQQGADAGSVESLEQGLVFILGSACRLYLGAGYTEKAVSIIQAVLEFHFFAPALSGPLTVQLRLFEAFWNSTVGMVGEEGAPGWAGWLTRGSQSGQAPRSPAAPSSPAETSSDDDDSDKGGWTGFRQINPESAKDLGEDFISLAEPEAEQAGPAEEAEDAQEEAEVEGSSDEEDLAAAKDAMEATLGRFKAGLWSAALAQSWAAREHAADCQALLPSTRWSSAQAAEADLHSSGNGGEPQEQARLGDTMAQWPEVQPCLFPLSSKGMRQMLAYTLLEVLEVPLGQWACSNSAAAMEACSASTSLSLTLAEALWSPHWPGAAGRGAPRPLLFCPPQALLLTDARPWLLLCDDQGLQPPIWLRLSCAMPFDPGKPENSASSIALAWFQASGARRAFVARLLAALVEGPLADDSRICAAFLAVECAPAVAEEQARGGDVLPAGGLETARAAAKRVLAVRRDSLALWGAYAELEAKAGNRKAARRVYETALASLAARPAAVGHHAALLALPFADMEASSGSKDATARALHVLAWLGAGGAFTSKAGAGAGTADARLLQARRGFQAMLSAHMSAGPLTQTGAAVVAAASLYELLAGQLGGGRAEGAAAINLVQQVLSAASPEVQRSSLEYEALHVRLCRMASRLASAGSASVSPGQLHSHLLTAVKMYPCNAELWALLAQAEAAAHMLSRLRRTLAAACTACPQSLAAVLASARCEASLAASSPRVVRIFAGAMREGMPLQRSPVLRRAYIAYLVSQQQYERANDIACVSAFYSCCWAKALEIDAFTIVDSRIVARMRPRDRLAAAQQRGLLLRTQPADLEQQTALQEYINAAQGDESQ